MLHVAGNYSTRSHLVLHPSQKIFVFVGLLVTLELIFPLCVDLCVCSCIFPRQRNESEWTCAYAFAHLIVLS